ncbi:hypothetical protein BJX76DRAFT_320288 [Aspergillus varians]
MEEEEEEEVVVVVVVAGWLGLAVYDAFSVQRWYFPVNFLRSRDGILCRDVQIDLRRFASPDTSRSLGRRECVRAGSAVLIDSVQFNREKVGWVDG